MSETAIIIPTLNEQDNIWGIVLAARQHGTVCVVDSSSGEARDATARVVASAGGRLIHTARGIRHQTVLGIEWAVLNGYRTVATLDAGGSHDPVALPALLAPVQAGVADVVIGSRYAPGSEYIGRPGRRVLSNLYARVCNWASACHVATDWTSGYRAYSSASAAVIVNSRYLSAGHAWQPEVLHMLARNGAQVTEVPIRYQAGRSSLRLHSVNEAATVLLMIVNAGPINDASVRATRSRRGV